MAILGPKVNAGKLLTKLALENTVETPVRIIDLVDQFGRAAEQDAVDSYNETSVRETFINPVFEELGWDPRNRRGAANRDRDVLLEDSVIIEGSAKAPDYAFIIDGKRRFFVEAKRPSVNLTNAKIAAHQIRRYCWSAGLPFGILTNFNEFAVYDCRAIPDTSDSAAVGRTAYFTYRELKDNWPMLARMFSKRSVRNGALDQLAADSREPRNSQPIDLAFLGEIRSWRKLLASDIAVRNPELNVVDLNAAVQTIIDRIIFLRIAEARGLEPVGALRTAISDGPGVYDRLMALFRRADDRYNSGLFHLSEKDDVGGPVDQLSDWIEVSDDPLTTVVGRLYYPQPYEFSVLTADILGKIYEQFLGETVTINNDRTATVELKPEVRKSGGVYYTPVPIVEYIVQTTVGPLLNGRTPAEVAKLRMVDPACGSGSFLIAVYQHLLDWHRDYYATKPRLAKMNLEVGTDGFFRLKTAERKRILTNNIFGVDIDPQAVEVTKLSLLLKVIEGQQQLELDIGRVLPDLDGNIVCGNSLIGVDFPMPMDLRPEEELKYNPFSWREKWPEIMAAGGFDAVVGNPPYLNIDNVWGKGDPRLQYIKSSHYEVYSDKSDILFYFLKLAVDICKGEIGYIVSRSFLEANKAQKLREWLGTNVRVREVLDFRNAEVFPKVGINTAIVRLTKSSAVRTSLFRRWQGSELDPGYSALTLWGSEQIAAVEVPYTSLGRDSWNFGDSEVQDLLAKLDAAGTPAGSILHIGKGMETGRNSSFVLDVDEDRYRELHEAGFAYRRARNSDIHSYHIGDSSVVMAFPYGVERFESLPMEIQRRLGASEETLKSRAAYERGDCAWWQYTWPLHLEKFQTPRIFCPYRSATNRFALDAKCEFIGITDTTVLYDNEQPEDLRYILGVLNSRIATFRFGFLGKLLGGGMFEYYENTVSKLPIPRRRPGDLDHDEMVNLVDRRMEAERDRRSSLLNEEKRMLFLVIESIDREIDALVRNMFGLSDDEWSLISSHSTVGA